MFGERALERFFADGRCEPSARWRHCGTVDSSLRFCGDVCVFVVGGGSGGGGEMLKKVWLLSLLDGLGRCQLFTSASNRGWKFFEESAEEARDSGQPSSTVR